MRLRAIACCVRRTRDFISGLPSVSLCSSRISCRLMRSPLWYCQMASGTSTMAMAPSAPPSAISAVPTSDSACPIAARVGSAPRPEKVWNCFHSSTVATSATTAKRASDLNSSITPRIENTRARPDAGFSRPKSGTSAWPLKVQPPIASGASTAAASSSPSNGAAVSRPRIAACSNCSSMRTLSSASPRPKVSPSRMIDSSRPPVSEPSNDSPRPPVSTTAAAPRSRERGTWPLARASSSRFCVGLSVRSRSSYSAIARLLGDAAERAQVLERGSEQIEETGLHAGQSKPHHYQTEYQRHRQPDREQVQARCRATGDAEGEIDHQQRGHAGQRDAHRAEEHLVAPVSQCLQHLRRKRARSYRQTAKTRHQGFYQRHVAIERDESQRTEYHVQLSE